MCYINSISVLLVTVDYIAGPKIDFFGDIKLPTLVFVPCFFQSVPVLILIDLGLVSDVACVTIDVAVDGRSFCSKKLKLSCKAETKANKKVRTKV